MNDEPKARETGEGLKACPFCASNLRPRVAGVKPSQQIECRSCGARGPQLLYKSTIGQEWNTRREEDALRSLVLDMLAPWDGDPGDLGALKAAVAEHQALYAGTVAVKVEEIRALSARAAEAERRVVEVEGERDAPIPMVLPCPGCGINHVDAPEPENGWTNPPHKSHLCHYCKTVWRPADVPTAGVAKTETRGERDTWPVVVKYREGDLEKFFGCDPDFTGGMDAGEYVDRVRGNVADPDEE